MSAAGHAKVKATKIEFRRAMLTLFPSLGERKIDELWAQLRTEATVEEIADVARPIHRLGARLHRARCDGRRWRS